MFAPLVTFVVTVVVLVGIRPLAMTARLVDRPGGRKHHNGAVPVVGGIAMYIGIVAGLAVLGIAGDLIKGFVFAALLLVLVGAADDAAGVRPLVRVLVQAAAVVIVSGAANLMLFSLGDPFGLGEIDLGPFALVGTLMVGITVVNAYNLIDGVDGLAATLAVIPLVTVAVLAGGDDPSRFLSVISVAAILAYLVFNLPVRANRPIRTFMGDAGSILVGFIVFWEVLSISQGEGARVSPVAGLWFASIPIYDALTCFVRRILKRKSPFSPGRDHFHHTLRRGGFCAQEKLAILGGLQIVYAAVGATGSLLGVPDAVLFFGWSALGLTQHKIIHFVAKRHRTRLLGRVRSGTQSARRTERLSALR